MTQSLNFTWEIFLHPFEVELKTIHFHYIKILQDRENTQLYIPTYVKVSLIQIKNIKNLTIKIKVRKELPPGPQYLASPLTSISSKHLFRLCCIFGILTTNDKEKLFLSFKFLTIISGKYLKIKSQPYSCIPEVYSIIASTKY